MRIAVVGGAKFDQAALDRFLWKLRAKYPAATIVTGSGRGAERHTQDSARTLGFPVQVPDLHPEWYGDEALLCQVGTVLLDADIILLVGTGGRVKRAWEYIHRINMHERDQRGGLVKKNGKYISRRTPGNELKFFQVAIPTEKLAKAA